MNIFNMKEAKKIRIKVFYDTLQSKGINCGIRHEQGTDIDAACGQLRSKQMKKSKIEK